MLSCMQSSRRPLLTLLSMQSSLVPRCCRMMFQHSFGSSVTEGPCCCCSSAPAASAGASGEET